MEVQKQGLSTSFVARKILAAALKNKEEILIGRSEILGVYCKNLFPTLFSKIIRNHPMKKIKAVKRLFNFKKQLLKYEY